VCKTLVDAVCAKRSRPTTPKGLRPAMRGTRSACATTGSPPDCRAWTLRVCWGHLSKPAGGVGSDDGVARVACFTHKYLDLSRFTAL
jgi:hypothetical protein